MRITPIHELWFSRNTAEWDAALKRYWDLKNYLRRPYYLAKLAARQKLRMRKRRAKIVRI
jgi:hypothetical protein